MRAPFRIIFRPLAFVTSIAACSATPARAVEILIPSYFYPSGGANNPWTKMNAAAGSVGLTAILNPDSGPGASVDSTYVSAVNSLRASGGRVIGYVSTVYGTRPIASVKADIAKYKSLYSLDGIFLDEMTNTNDAAALNYYADVYAYIKSLDPNFRVTGNPGTNTTPAYLTKPATDTLVTFESDAGYASWNPSPWTSGYATRRFSNLPYAIADSTAMTTAINAAAAKRVGYVYVTDDSGANPWDRLPTYWDAELATIRAITPTWNSAASGDWNEATNWTTPAAPNAVGAEAMLFNAISAPRTIYTNAPLTLGTLVFNNANRYVLTGAGTLTMDASVESALIDVRRGDHTINLPLTLRDPTVAFVAVNASLTIADPMTIEATGSLTKTGPGTLIMQSIVTDLHASLTVSGGTLAFMDEARFASIALAPGAAIDVGTAPLTIGNVGSADEIRAMIATAYVDGAWTGPGITSSRVTDGTGVGYKIDANGVGTIALVTSGDANLDGVVDFGDLLLVVNASEAAVWSTGDFNYDGKFDVADVSVLESSYAAANGAGAFSADWKLAQSLVPEPATAVLGIAIGSVAAVRNRSR